MTPLNYALLGLIRAESRTGYALRMVFENTPMGNFSSSPGSVYPALKNLVKAGLVEAREAGARKSLYALTPSGDSVFASWLIQPVTEAEDTGTALLRFAFLHDHPEPKVTLDFLASFGAVMRGRVAELKLYLAGDDARNMPLQARLAVVHGLATTQASAEWAEVALTQLQGNTR